MALLRAAAALCQQSPGSSLGGPLLHLLRQFATGPTNEAVERTIVVDTLAQVFCSCMLARVTADTFSAVAEGLCCCLWPNVLKAHVHAGQEV